MTDSKMIRLEKTLLLLWFILNLSIGALTVHGYGMSLDEPNNYRYAVDTLDAYPSVFGIRYEPKYDSSYDGHGPAFMTIAGIAVRIIQAVFPKAVEANLWHFLYFMTFQLAGFCLYWLTKRWFSTWTAWGILVLFGTQPLLLGHSFINPKDIPFMFLFTLSVVFGLRLVDSLRTRESFISLQEPVEVLTRRVHETDPRHRRKFLSSLALALATALLLVIFSHQIKALIEQTVTFFYAARADTWAGRIFASVASHASNLTATDYATKALRLFRRAEQGLLIAGVLFFLVYFCLLIGNTTLSAFLRDSWNQRYRFGETITNLVKSLRASLNSGSLKISFAGILRELRNPQVILAGATLGLATGVRAIAPLAGAIVFLDLFVRARSKAWTSVIAYFLITGMVAYVAWPRLWGAPIQRYLEALGVSSNFSHFSGRVLFGGHFYGISELPYSYLPILLNIQLTEPFLLSFYAGLGVLMWRLLHGWLHTDSMLYIILGFVFPFVVLILLRPPLYHNFRQALFLIPAMFMVAAFALELVFNNLPQKWVRVLLIVIIALPGIYSSIRLYPYEYVYYNSLVGGTAGATNHYELDYWRTSLHETAIELNRFAPEGAKIIISGSAGLFNRYARPDLVVDTVTSHRYDLNGEYDYAVQVARWQKWDLYRGAKNVVLIARDGTVLATVKAVRNVDVK